MHERWARLRLSVIGALLAAPPAKGALRAALQQLAAREWRHPNTGAPVRFGVSTLERWYYRSRNETHDPVSVLRRKRRQDAGEQASMTPPLRQALRAQYVAHKSWSAQLHHDNLVALAETRSELRPMPSYATVRRFLSAHGLTRHRPTTTRQTVGALAATARLEAREVRSYEAEYVNGTWHWDCHYGPRKVLTPRGEWQIPILFGVLDDRSRLACHLQWYLSRIGAEHRTRLAAGDAKARPAARRDERQRRRNDGDRDHRRPGQARYPASNHAALFALSERQAGGPLGIGRGTADGHARGRRRSRPGRLNEATQAWVEYDYNRKRHSEIDGTPLARFLAGPAVTRPCPDVAALRLAFTRTERRTLRKSDGTAVIEGRRFEVPNQYRHLPVLEVRFAAWDLGQVHLVDPHTGTVLCRLFPQDKTRNARIGTPRHAGRSMAAVLSCDKSWVLAMLAAKRRLRVAPVPPQAADLTRPARVAPGNAKSGRRNRRRNRTKEQIRPSIQPWRHDHPSHTVVRPMGVRLNYASHTEIRILPCGTSTSEIRVGP